MKQIFLLSLLSFVFLGVAIGQSSLQGIVTDEANGEPISFGTIALFRNGVFITGGETDLDGNYIISNLDGGTYDVEASYVGYQSQRITGVLIQAGRANKLNIGMTTDGGVILEEIVVKEYKVPLVDFDNTTQGAVITSKDINVLPSKSIAGIASLTAGVSTSDDGEGITFRGSREDATVYFIDGIRVQSNLIPQTEVEQLEVITGGIDAQYGDVTGGIISITTKGPSAEYSGAVELETSQFLDPFGYNLINAGVGGPIKKDLLTGNTIIGFRVAGQYRYNKSSAGFGPIYKANDAYLDELEANPMTRAADGGFVPSAQFFDVNDIESLDYYPNADNASLDFIGKIDAKVTDALDATLSGSFTNNYSNSGGENVFNFRNRSQNKGLSYRGNLKFRYKVLNSFAEEGKENKKRIQNITVNLLGGYENSAFTFENEQLGDNLFNYGYVGKFNFDFVPVVSTLEGDAINRSDAIQYQSNTNPNQSVYYAHTGYEQRFRSYERNDEIQPILANYNNIVPADADFANYIATNGNILGGATNIFNFHQNVGLTTDFYTKARNSYYTLNLNASFDLYGKKKKIKHQIRAGVMYEQNILRSYSISPDGLWNLARTSANRHLNGVDTTRAVGAFPAQVDENNRLEPDEFTQYAPFNTEDQFGGSYFFRRIREAVGLSTDEYINIDGIDPAVFALDMFSARELSSFAGINLVYSGYDHTGKELPASTSFNDFWTATDENGVNTYPVAPAMPSYAAAFIQDKFQINEVIFRLGLRVERYASNSSVLRDPYSLYELMSADDFYAGPGADQVRPENIADGYKVYVSSESPNSPGRNSVTAFREGDQWFTSEGVAVSSSNDIFGMNGVAFGRYYDDRVNDIKAAGYDPNQSFEPHKANIVLSPRLSFSFPISDFASFFAHYDLLAQRPPPGLNYASPLNYFYLGDRFSAVNNSNLKPQKTVDYEIGFQQKVGNNSSVKFSAYYKELRDLIQLRIYTHVVNPIGSYQTFDNIDFGTVKGFAFQYDLRRTKNIQFRTTYTLQFAEGTGSDARSQQTLAGQGNLRTVAPLNYDERHRFNFMIDYRFDEGAKYNGPVIGKKKIFERTGVNLQSTFVSGRPYTASLAPSPLSGAGLNGEINGARLPWNYWLNLRVDKTFRIAKRKDGTSLDLNVYFRVQNLLNTQNVLDVYTATGSPTDDGFLRTPQGQATIANNGALAENFLAAYNWALINEGFFTAPRRMFVGAIMEF